MDFREKRHLRVLYNMLPKQFQDLLEKFSRGACSQEEEQLIIDWYNSIGQPEKGAFHEDQKGQVEEKLWAAIKPSPKKRPWLPLLTRAAIITVPLLAVAVYYFSRQPLSEYISPRYEAFTSEESDTRFKNQGSTGQKITLSDGTEVLLQPASEIALSNDFGKTSRELRLKGEAFFQVQRDEHRPFVVHSNEVVTRVLGTSFNVRAYEHDGEITVAVRSGKVSVYANNNKTSGVNRARAYKEVILTPNQQMIYHREREEVSKQVVEKPEVILPNSNLFHMQFENAAVSKIFEVLEENYGIEIRYDEDILNNCRLTTSMSDEGLYERIEVICKAIGASYVIDNDAVITIKSNGC
jgi:hypothetical protein